MSFVTTLAEALLILRVDGSKVDPELEKETKKFQDRMDKFGKIAEGVRNAATVGFLAGVTALGMFVSAAEEAEAQTASFRTQMQMLGGDFRARIPEMERFADALGRAGDFDNEDIQQKLAQTVQLTGSVTEGMLLMENAVDLARMRQLDLNTAVDYTIQAWNGQERGLKKLIGSLGEGLRGHDAMVAMQKKVAGQAEATAGTVERSRERMDLAWEATREKLGQDVLPTVIRLYDWIGNLAHQLEGVNGNTILWTTGILGAVAAGAQLTKWILELRGALALLKLAQAASNAESGATLNLWKAIPPQAKIVGAALAILGGQYLEAARAAREFNEASGRNAGGAGDEGVWTTNQAGDRIFQRVDEFNAEFGAPSGLQILGANLYGFNSYRVLREQQQRIDQAQDSIAMLKQQAADARAQRETKSARNQEGQYKSSISQEVRTQFAGSF
jgi:hypothetical protein